MSKHNSNQTFWCDKYIIHHYKDNLMTVEKSKIVLRHAVQTVIEFGIPEEKLKDLMELAYQAGRREEAQINSEREAGASI